MDPREELIALRRLAELEGKAKRASGPSDADRELYSPLNGMSGVGKFVAGYGAAVPQMVRGVGQALGLVSQSDVDEAKRLEAPLMASGAGMAGNITGNIAATLPAIAIPGAGTLRGAALVGGGMGAIQPVATGESRLQNIGIGGAAGAGGVAAARVIGAGAQGAKALVEPFTATGRDRIAGRMIQRFADDPSKIAGLSNQPTVTGALPTLAEQTGDVGLARLQDSLRSVDPQINSQITNRLAENNAARVNSLQSLAGNSAQRDAAELARSTATKPLYEQATKAAYTVDDQLANLLQRPAVKQAMARAETLAANQNRSVSFGVEPSNPFSGMGVPTNSSTQIKGQALQDLKMAMDEMLSDPASGFAGKAGNTVRDLRGQLVNWMEGANPAFKDARQTYSAMSKPLNAMDVGEEVAKRATSNTSDLAGNPRMQANALLGMLRDEPGLLRRATGRKELNALSDVMDPQQMNLLRSVAGETDRAAAVASAGNGPGSATAQRMASQNVLRQLVGPTGLPASWGESVIGNTVIGKPFNLLYGGVAEPKIQQALAEAVLNPMKAQQVIQMAQALPPAQRGQVMQMLQAALAQGARSAPAALAVSGER